MSPKEMTKTEAALLEAVLKYDPEKVDWRGAAEPPFFDMLEAVREERLPAELWEAALRAEREWKEAREVYRGRVTDMRLNHQGESVDTALRKARAEVGSEPNAWSK